MSILKQKNPDSNILLIKNIKKKNEMYSFILTDLVPVGRTGVLDRFRICHILVVMYVYRLVITINHYKIVCIQKHTHTHITILLMCLKYNIPTPINR